MTAATAMTAPAPDMAALWAASEYADATYSIHYRDCRNVLLGRDCRRCDDLWADVVAAEDAYNAAMGEVA